MAAGLGSRGWAAAGRQLGSGTQASLGGNSLDGGEVGMGRVRLLLSHSASMRLRSYPGPGHCCSPQDPLSER